MANFTSNRGRKSFRSSSSTQATQTSVYEYVPRWAVVMENGEVCKLMKRATTVISADERQNDTAVAILGGNEVDDVDMAGKTTMTIHDIFNAIIGLIPQGVDAEVWSRGSNGAKGDTNRFDEGTDRMSMTLFHRVYIDVVITSDSKVVASETTKKYGNVFFSVRTMCGDWCESATMTDSWRKFIDAVQKSI